MVKPRCTAKHHARLLKVNVNVRDQMLNNGNVVYTDSVTRILPFLRYHRRQNLTCAENREDFIAMSAFFIAKIAGSYCSQ